MRKYLSSLLFVLITSSIWAQFHTQTELKYLQIINKLENKELIRNNLWNAELTSDSILQKKENTMLQSSFFLALSQSYFLIEKYDLALFNLYKQRILFPNDSIERESQQLFFELTYRNNYKDSASKTLQNQTDYKHIPRAYNQRLNLLLQKSIHLHSSLLIPHIFRLSHLYEKFSVIKPLWLSHWEYLSLIKLKEKHKKQIIQFDTSKADIYKSIHNKKLLYKVYRKSIKHYLKHNALHRSQELIQDYQSCSLPFFLKCDLIIKKIRWKTKALL